MSPNLPHPFSDLTTRLSILCVIIDLIQIAILASFPGWHEEAATGSQSTREVKTFPVKRNTWFLILCSFTCSLGLYVAIVWQHIAVAVAAVPVEGLRYGLVEVGAGTSVVVLSWLSVVLTCVCVLGIVLMVISIHTLYKMAE